MNLKLNYKIGITGPTKIFIIINSFIHQLDFKRKYR